MGVQTEPEGAAQEEWRSWGPSCPFPPSFLPLPPSVPLTCCAGCLGGTVMNQYFFLPHSPPRPQRPQRVPVLSLHRPAPSSSLRPCAALFHQGCTQAACRPGTRMWMSVHTCTYTHTHMYMGPWVGFSVESFQLCADVSRQFHLSLFWEVCHCQAAAGAHSHIYSSTRGCGPSNQAGGSSCWGRVFKQFSPVSD